MLITLQLQTKHPLCKGQTDANTLDFDCGYETVISCDDCKYGGYMSQPDSRLGLNLQRSATNVSKRSFP